MNRPGAILERPAQHLDVPPTLLDLLGLPHHPAFQGESLVGSRGGGEARFIVAQSPLAHQYAVVRNGWKLIYDVRANRKLLYNLEEDPGESRDVSNGDPARVAELSRLLGGWRKAQVTYYSTPYLYGRYYPPDLVLPASR